MSPGEHPGLGIDMRIMKPRPKQLQQGRAPPGHSQGLQVRTDEVKVVEDPVIKIKLQYAIHAFKVKVRQ